MFKSRSEFFLPWLKQYSTALFSQDLTAAMIVSVLLIPQALAYALLAGLPPQTGLYASLLPLLAYGLLGRSAPLSVGPFAITSIMTASVLHQLFDGPVDDTTLIATGALLAFCVGGFLLLFGLLRLGFLSNFISIPVMIGFISASALVIASSQITHLLGLPDIESGQFFLTLYHASLLLGQIHWPTAITALVMLALLKWLPIVLQRVVVRLSGRDMLGDIVSKATPLLVVALSIVISASLDFEALGIEVVGAIPTGFPTLDWHQITHLDVSGGRLHDIVVSAALISLIGFVSSLSTAQAFAAKQRQRIVPNQEAVALGVSNLLSGLSGAFPVAASLSRSAVSFKAGAQTPATSIFTAASMALSCLFLTPYLYHLPIATLTAMIILAVLSLFDHEGIKRTLRYSYQDALALVVTMAATLILGVEWGLVAGVVASIALYLYRSSRPHIAVLGKIPDEEHFRNIERHEVMTDECILSVRVDASLYFANANYLQDTINALLANAPKTEHLILNCIAVNRIDASALESLLIINEQLADANVVLHLSEVKGPVMDKLKRSDLLKDLTGQVYLSHHQAWQALRCCQ